jgi:DNA repair protein RadC
MEVIREINENVNFKSAKDVYAYLDEFKNQDREFFIVIGLDNKNKPVYREIANIGTINSTLVSATTTFRKAVLMNCNSIIIAHNHPSGDVAPSKEDKQVYEELKKAGDILKIKVLDSIIIGINNYYRFNEEED